MDAFLFADLVPEEKMPNDGPDNRRRAWAYMHSLWLNADHERFAPCRFEDYLSRRGWDEELLLCGRWRAAHPDNANKSDDDCIYHTVATIQAWMTLGFLEDLLQDREWPALYLQPVRKEMVFNSNAMLPSQDQWDGLWKWLRCDFIDKVRIFRTTNFVLNLAAISFGHKTGLEINGLTQQHFARLPTLIEHYARTFNRLKNIDRYDEEKGQVHNLSNQHPKSSSVFLLTLPFQKLIFEAVRFNLHACTPDATMGNIPQENFMVQTLQSQSGWCPSIIEKLRQTTSYAVFHWFWASELHTLDGRDHSDCTISKCAAMHVSSEADYPEAHAKGCNGTCDRYRPYINPLLDALASEHIPLIVATPIKSDSSRFTFNVTSISPRQSEAAVPYVAFSHVWSDGLGSTAENGIPVCQANFLAQVARSQNVLADGRTAFWIDSLCVPAASEARKQSIQLMSHTYKMARPVLVLDSTLRKVALYDDAGKQASPELLLLRILTSPWSQRVWTYQEGALAQKLVFLVASGHSFALDFSPHLDGDPKRSPLSLQLGRDMFHQVYADLRAQVQVFCDQVRPSNIGDVALELRWRDTLHRNPKGRNDEILAIGTLLGIDMARLLDESEGEARMAVFYRLVGRLYRNIVFADIPRLQVDGFRWAPTTFLVKDTRRPATDLENEGVICIEHGLLGSYYTFAVAGGREVLYDSTRRMILVDEQSVFNLLSPSRRVFSFTHMLIYPSTPPQSSLGTIVFAAAVKADTEYARTHQISEPVDFVGVFQTILYISWVHRPATVVKAGRIPNREQLVPGRMSELKVLLR
ncbi:MAG: hypothetical protein M1822_004297 [Bathelium mastoideum]|nr:MAG: hypothetical protein M1822_004297 [Bathelium mastoideum]